MKIRSDGFTITQVSDEVKTIRVNYDIDVSDRFAKEFAIEKAKREITNKLVDDLVDGRCITIFESTDFCNQGIKVSAEIHFVESGNKYVNFFDNIFTVKGEKFTNEELVEAVKNTFPERLI